MKKLEKNDILTYIAFFCLIAVITIPTVITVNREHQKRILHVTITRIKESAERCFNREECEGDRVTLRELYKKNFLEPVSNPITMEYYNENSYVIIDEYGNIEFIEIKN